MTFLFFHLSDIRDGMWNKQDAFEKRRESELSFMTFYVANNCGRKQNNLKYPASFSLNYNIWKLIFGDRFSGFDFTIFRGISIKLIHENNLEFHWKSCEIGVIEIAW
jgi:hypothetical protein